MTVVSIFSSKSCEKSQNVKLIPLRQIKVLFLSCHTSWVANTAHSSSDVPPGLFGNTAWRFILLCEILSSPLASPCLNLFTPLLSGLSRKVNVSVISQPQTHVENDQCPLLRRICILAWQPKTLYDGCQHQSFSSSSSNISAVTIPTHINRIELPALYQFPRQPVSREEGESERQKWREWWQMKGDRRAVTVDGWVKMWCEPGYLSDV